MNTLKGWITTFVLMTTLMVSTTFANGGILIAGLSEPTNDPCAAEKAGKTDLSGTVIAGIGILIAGSN